MRKLFGTDGIRGLAGESPLDAQTIYATGLSLAHVVQQHGRNPRVLLGRDTRESGTWISQTLAAGLAAGGAQVVSAGVVPTPAIAHLVHTQDFSAGVVVSASHNPWRDNGIKIFGKDGYKLPDDEELAIETEIFSRQHVEVPELLPQLVEDATLVRSYIAWLQSQVPLLNLNGLKLSVDCANGAASALAPGLLRSLGADVRAQHFEPDGRNINEACGALHPDVVARDAVADGSALGVTFDGDADRVLFASASGRVISGDGVLLLLAKALKQRRKLTGDTVVATTMSNMGLESALRAEAITMLRAPVGDKYVLEQMIANGAVLGGEQSGHIILLDRATTGDGLLTALLFLETVAAGGGDADAMLAELKTYPQIIVNVHVREKPPLESLPAVAAAVQAAEAALQGNGRINVRYSGTEKLARVMAEAESEAAMRRYADLVSNAIRGAIGAA